MTKWLFDVLCWVDGWGWFPLGVIYGLLYTYVFCGPLS